MNADEGREIGADEFLAGMIHALPVTDSEPVAGDLAFDSRTYATPMGSDRPPLPPEPPVRSPMDNLAHPAINPFVRVTIS